MSLGAAHTLRRVLARLKRAIALLLGADDDPALRPLLYTAFLSALANSAFFTYIGIWAVKELGADAADVGIMFLLAAPAGALTGYLGGHLSDRIGRKPVIVWSLGAETLVIASLLLVGHNVALGFGIVVVGWAVSAPWWSAQQALVADLLPEERREAGYAMVRVVNNLAIVLGPPLGSVLLLLGSWDALITGSAIGAAVAFAVAAAVLPRLGAHAHEEPGGASLGVILRDRPFLLLLASTVLAFMVYVSYETAIPIVAVDSFGYDPATWGLLLIVNPALVTLFQLRLTRATAEIPAATKLAVAIPLMGFPLLLLLVTHDVPVLLFVLVVFVIGEMLWVPTSQALAARLAPAHLRGAYMGAYGGSNTVGWMISPLIALQLRGASGNAAMWGFFAASSLAGAMAGVAASRRIPRDEPGPAVAGDRAQPA
jgi:predicted MFS family arabinose efflux permease